MTDQAQTTELAAPAPTAPTNVTPPSQPARVSTASSLPMAALLDPLAHNVTADELYALARTLAASEIVPTALQGKPASVFAVIARGLELGITPMTAVCEIHVIHGRTQLSAHLQAARVLSSGKAKEFRIIESTPDRAVLRVQRHEWPEPRDIEWTIAEAKALGLDQSRAGRGPSPWVTQPANMLRRRVTTRACREHFPDVIIAYDPGEIDEFEAPSPGGWSAPAAPSTPTTPPPPPDRTLAPTAAADEVLDAELVSQQDKDRDVVLAVMADLAAAQTEEDLKRSIGRASDLKRRADAGEAEAAAHIAELTQAYRGRSAALRKAGAGKRS